MMGEVKVTDYHVGDGGGDGGGDGEKDRVIELETGLPEVDDLTPLSKSLISPELLVAFSISPEPYQNMFDVNLASENTFLNLGGEVLQQPLNNFNKLESVSDDKEDCMVVEGDETADLTPDGSDSRKLQRVDSGGDYGGVREKVDNSSVTTSKRHRMAWSPQLHKRFIEVVKHLGVKKAVPKTIMKLMNVEGLTRENVASHLQKYRLFLKRMQGASTKGPPSDHLFASTSGGGGGNGSGHGPGPIPMHYPQQMVQMPYPPHQMVPNSAGGSGGAFPYNMMQQRDWLGSSFGLVSDYHHQMTPNDE